MILLGCDYVHTVFVRDSGMTLFTCDSVFDVAYLALPNMAFVRDRIGNRVHRRVLRSPNTVS